MLTVTPYLFFAGHCEEALSYYQHCFDGHVVLKKYFRDAPEQIEGVNPDWVMHAEFQAHGMTVMLSDGLAARELGGNNIALSVVTDELSVQEQIFNRLAAEGHVMMPLAESFWGARFGKVEDKFGVRWMLHAGMSR